MPYGCNDVSEMENEFTMNDDVMMVLTGLTFNIGSLTVTGHHLTFDDSALKDPVRTTLVNVSPLFMATR